MPKRNIKTSEELTNCEKFVLKIAGSNSQKWDIDEFLKALKQNGTHAKRFDKESLSGFLKNRPHLFEFAENGLFSAKSKPVIKSNENEEILVGSLTDLEKLVVKVTGDNSQKWNINQLFQALKEITQFNKRSLLVFLNHRPHLFKVRDGLIATKFESLEGLPTLEPDPLKVFEREIRAIQKYSSQRDFSNVAKKKFDEMNIDSQAKLKVCVETIHEMVR